MSKEKELKKLGGNVKRIRLEQGLSQTDVAKTHSRQELYQQYRSRGWVYTKLPIV